MLMFFNVIVPFHVIGVDAGTSYTLFPIMLEDNILPNVIKNWCLSDWLDRSIAHGPLSNNCFSDKHPSSLSGCFICPTA